MNMSLSAFFRGRQPAQGVAPPNHGEPRHIEVAVPRDNETGCPRRNVYGDPGVYHAIEGVTAKAHANAQRLHEEAINRLYPGAYAVSGPATEVFSITQAAYDHMDVAAGRKLEQDLLRAGFRLPGGSWTYRAVAKSGAMVDRLADKVGASGAPDGLKRVADKGLSKLGAAVRGIRKPPLNYPGMEHVRDRRTYFDLLRRADKSDTAAHALSASQRSKRLRLERQLVYYQRLYESAHAYLQQGAIKLSGLFAYDAGRRGLQLLPRSVGEIDAFFRERFDLVPDGRASKDAEKKFAKAGNDAAGQEQVLRDHLHGLLAKVPLGLGEGAGGVAGNGLLGLAEAYATEIGLQRQSDIGEHVMQIDKSVWLAPHDDPAAGPGSFRLVQPFGQDNWALRSKQLVATRDAGTGRYKLELKTFSYFVEVEGPDGGTEKKYVSATGFDDPNAVIREELSTSVELPPGREAMEMLRQHFSVNNLDLLFDDGGGLGTEDYKTVAARVTAKRMINEKANDIVCRHVDEQRDRYLEQTKVISGQETGYFFNSGMYGENICVKSRERFMDRFSKKVPVVGSCGSHQRVAADHGRPIIALEHLPPYLKFLLNRHGSDPYTLGETGKQTIGAYNENTLAAGVMETPLDIVPHAAGKRDAEPGRPVAQSKETPLLTRDVDNSQHLPLNQREYIEPGAASRPASLRRVWRPRDAANLCLHVRMSQDDPVGQPFTFYQPQAAVPRLAPATPEELKAKGPSAAQGTARVGLRQIPVQVSENLRLRAVVMQDGTRTPISEAALTLDRLRELSQLDGFSHLEMTHEIPEGWALCDDNRQPIRDDDGNEVRLLERVLIKPHLLPSMRKELVHEPDAAGNPSPVYEDERGVRVFPTSQPGQAEPVFEDASGIQATGRVRLKYVEVEDKDPALRFEITGIERWTRVPMPDAPGSQVVATRKGDGKPDRVLCTYRKTTLAHGDRNFQQALYSLRDNLYFEMNCIHSQNPVSDLAREMPGPEEVAVSVVPNDGRMPRSFMTAWSRQNPRTHAIHVDWMAPIQSLILEGLENSNRGNKGFLVTLHTHQGHRDMGTDDMGARLHPDYLTDYTGKIRKEYLAQLQGNLEGVFAAVTQAQVGALVREIALAAAQSLPERTAIDRVDESKLAAAENTLREIDETWQAYGRTRRPEDARRIIGALAGSRHVQLVPVADALLRNMNGWATEGATAGVFSAVSQDVAALLSVLDVEAQAAPPSAADLRRQTRIRDAMHHLRELETPLAALQAVLKGEADGDVNCYALARVIANGVDNVQRRLAADGPPAGADALARLRTSVAALVNWEREPETLRRELRNAISSQRAALTAGEEVTVSREKLLMPGHIVSIRDQEVLRNGYRRPGIAGIRTRNDALANRYLADRSAEDGEARYTPLFRLFLEQDYLPPRVEVEEDGAAYRERRKLYWAEKDALAASLQARAADIANELPGLRRDPVLNRQRIGQLEQEKVELEAAAGAWERFRTRAAATFETGDDAQRAAWMDGRTARLRDLDAALQEKNEAILHAAAPPEQLSAERAGLLEERLRLRSEIRQARRIEMLEAGRDWLAGEAPPGGAVQAATREVERLRTELASIGARVARQETWLQALRENPAERPQILEQMQAARNDTDRFSGMGLDELQGEREMLAAELADARELLDNLVSVVDRQEPVRTPGALARMGHVLQTDGVAATRPAAAQAGATAPEDAVAASDDANWAQQVESLAVALAGPDSNEKAQAIDDFVAACASRGLLDVLFPVGHAGEDDRIAAAVQLLSSPEFAQSMRDTAPAELAGIYPQAMLGLLGGLRRQLPVDGEADDESMGRVKQNYPDRTRRTQLANMLLAGMAGNTAIVGTFGQVKEAIALANRQAADSLGGAEAATALGADAAFGLLQIAAGANLVKDARYTLRHLEGSNTGTRAVVEGAIQKYDELAAELRGLLEQLQQMVDRVPDAAGPAEKRQALHALGELLDRHLEGYHNRLQLIRRDVVDAKVNAASGALLMSGMSAVLASATAKAVSAAAKSEVAATAADASGISAVVAGSLYTALGLAQTGLSARRLLSLRRISEELAFELGYGVDSGERRAGNVRMNELYDMAKRQLKAWGFFTFGGVLVTIAGAANAGGAAPFVGAPLNFVGSWMISGAVVHLYKLPLDLRGKDARVAFSTAHIDDGFLNTNRRLNQLGSCNRDKAGIQQETMWKFGRDVFDEKDDKAMRRTYLSAWFVPGAQRAALTKAIRPSLDKPASIQVQYDFMQRTNVAELNWRYVEVEERTRDLDQLKAALGAYLEGMLDLNNARTGGGRAQPSREPVPSANDNTVRLSQTMFSSLQNHIILMERKLDAAIRARDAALDLQNQLQAFSPELDREPREETRAQLRELRLRWMLVNQVFVAALGEDAARKMFQDHSQGKGPQNGARFSAVFDKKLYGPGSDGAIPARAKLERAEIDATPQNCEWIMDWISDSHGGRHVDDMFVRAMVDCLPEACATESAILGDIHIERLGRLMSKKTAQAGGAVRSADTQTAPAGGTAGSPAEFLAGRPRGNAGQASDPGMTMHGALEAA